MNKTVREFETNSGVKGKIGYMGVFAYLLYIKKKIKILIFPGGAPTIHILHQIKMLTDFYFILFF